MGCTKLLKVIDSKVEEVFSADEEFFWINTLIVLENMVYVSMDKMVVSIDLTTSKFEYYTNLSEESELDILVAAEEARRRE